MSAANATVGLERNKAGSDVDHQSQSQKWNPSRALLKPRLPWCHYFQSRSGPGLDTWSGSHGGVSAGEWSSGGDEVPGPPQHCWGECRAIVAPFEF